MLQPGFGATKASSHQGDEISEGQLDLNLQRVFRMNHWADILVVATEQVADQLGLLITLHCMKTKMRDGVSLHTYVLKLCLIHTFYDGSEEKHFQ